MKIVTHFTLIYPYSILLPFIVINYLLFPILHSTIDQRASAACLLSCPKPLLFPSGSPRHRVQQCSGEPTAHNVSDSCRGLDYNTQFINRCAKQMLHLLVHSPLAKGQMSHHIRHDHRAFKNSVTNGQRGNLLNLASLPQLNPTPKKK